MNGYNSQIDKARWAHARKVLGDDVPQSVDAEIVDALQFLGVSQTPQRKPAPRLIRVRSHRHSCEHCPANGGGCIICNR